MGEWNHLKKLGRNTNIFAWHWNGSLGKLPWERRSTILVPLLKRSWLVSCSSILFISVRTHRATNIRKTPTTPRKKTFVWFCSWEEEHRYVQKQSSAYHTDEPKYNIQYLRFREEVLTKLNADNRFKETNHPVGKNRRNIAWVQLQ